LPISVQSQDLTTVIVSTGLYLNAVKNRRRSLTMAKDLGSPTI